MSTNSGQTMNSRNIFERVKKATVAIVISEPTKAPKAPFTIVGSGFCIHPEGIVVTCEHVFKTFVDEDSYKHVMELIAGKRNERFEAKSIIPRVLFLHSVLSNDVEMALVPIAHAVTKTDFDLAAFRLHKTAAFADGFPALEIADYDEVHEMLEIATCGFPLGNALQDQLGTVTSSFTRGVISSIIPAPYVQRDQVRGFQLDLTATNGNSGGPVFVLSTGKVFGVLQAGAVHPAGHVVGLIKAEPVYRIFDNDLVNRLVAGAQGQG
jgi:S1-C subfamily serine protease